MAALNHPFRVVLTGPERRVRELAQRLVPILAREFSVGHVRVDPGSQANQEYAESAAHTLLRSGESGTRLSKSTSLDTFDASFALLDCDLVIEESVAVSRRRAGPLAGAASHDHAGVVLEAATQQGTKAIAQVGGGASRAVSHFVSHDYEAIAATVRSQLLASADQTPLYGLVLAGGRSTRMGRDKWALDYHGEPQALALHRLLTRACERAFVSVRTDQIADTDLASVPTITDRFLGMGPLGGILSALTAHPEAAWLVLACDLPFVTDATLETLRAGRQPLRFATTFVSPRDGLPEPLCAIYEPKARLRLHQSASLGHRCPRKMLINSRIALVESGNAEELTNANDPDDYRMAIAQLRAGGQS